MFLNMNVVWKLTLCKIFFTTWPMQENKVLDFNYIYWNQVEAIQSVSKFENNIIDQCFSNEHFRQYYSYLTKFIIE